MGRKKYIQRNRRLYGLMFFSPLFPFLLSQVFLCTLVSSFYIIQIYFDLRLHTSFFLDNKYNVQQLDMLTMSAVGNTLTNFDHRSTSSFNQTTTTIKQQPFSPPPYHPLTNGYFTHHHQQRSTPSPDNEQISPLSNNRAERTSTPSIVPPSATGGGW